MIPLFRHRDLNGEFGNWTTRPQGWTMENTRSILIMPHQDETCPLSFRLFGYERYKPGKRVVRSVRPYIVRYVVDGRGTFNGEPISRGTCYLSAPGQKYIIESDTEEPLVHYWFELIGSKAPVYIERMLGTTKPGTFQLSNIAHYENVFYPLFFRNLSFCNLSTYFYSVFFHLLSLHQNEHEESSTVSAPMTMYMEAVDYIESHLNSQIKVTDLCHRLHIVPDYLYKIFKRYSGMSTQEYIVSSKMRVAEILLSSPEHSIADIADMVGYADQGQLTKAFRRIYNMTPSAYRRKALSKKNLSDE